MLLALALPLLAAQPQPDPLVLEGSWELASAYEILADGSRATAYGEHPRGRMMVDADGRYSIQIFHPDRPRFAAGDKTRGTPEEYRAAVLGSSTHFGRVHALPDGKTLVFNVESASWPNWEGREQRREYSFRDGVLRYAVPASASGNGTIAWSVWRKLR